MLDRLTIPRKLLLLFALFLVPLGVVTFLLMANAHDGIAFSQKERTGVGYLKTIWPSMDMAAMQSPTGARDAPTAAIDTLKTGQSRYDAELSSRAESEALANVLGQWSGAEKNARTLQANTITATAALIARVGDTSNLILDPDLDSYYTMDMVIARLPTLVAALISLNRSYQDYAADPSSTTGLTVLNDATTFAAATVALRNDFAAAYDGNADHSLEKGALSAAQRRLETALKPIEDNLAPISRSVLLGAQPPLTGEAFQENTRAATTAISATWTVASDELDRLLTQRVQHDYEKLWLQLAIIASTLALALVMGVRVGHGLNRAIRRLTGVMQDLSSNQIDIVVPYAALPNEVGALARGMEAYQCLLREQAVLAAQLEEERERAQEQLVERVAMQSRMDAEARASERETQAHESRMQEQAAILALAAQLETSMSQPIQRLGTSAVQLGACARQMHGLSEHTDAQASQAAQAAQLAQDGVNTVVPAVEQVSASIRMIAGEVNAAQTISTEAVRKATEADQQVEGLSAAARKIGEIISLIDAIAEQTNLLALNATIEAARAGDAGRGFAVVASEVKALAGQTAHATRQIAEQIAAIQSSTDGAVGAIREINATIGLVNAAASKIAMSINEQTGVLAGINRAVGTVATGVQKATHGIVEVDKAAADTRTASKQVQDASEEVRAQVERLHNHIVNYIGSLSHARAA